MVITRPPALKIGVQLIVSTAQMATASPKRRRPNENMSRLVPSARIGLKKRTPNSFAPKRCVPSHMVAAMPGPLEK